MPDAIVVTEMTCAGLEAAIEKAGWPRCSEAHFAFSKEGWKAFGELLRDLTSRPHTSHLSTFAGLDIVLDAEQSVNVLRLQPPPLERCVPYGFVLLNGITWGATEATPLLFQVKDVASMRVYADSTKKAPKTELLVQGHWQAVEGTFREVALALRNAPRLPA